jgi:hypothetical protein
MYTKTDKGYSKAKAPVPLKETSGPGLDPVDKFSVIVTDKDREAVARDPFTSRVFGEKAAEIYAAGLRPSIGQDGSYLYMPTDDKFKLEDGRRLGFRKNRQNDKFAVVAMTDDGQTKELDDAQGTLSELGAKEVIDLVSKVYTKRYNDIAAK